ncbi:hypothetical protein J1N35_040165 [Gossypium stocksii]|uniref:Uncharacterized protein n=1 Tax=Gossypium stocksii TaxID=47602 RepID=A0A9D3UDG2_9ROSI|nr:hypothetical protein J1N35_040165 [Gossypium stocksii]
MQKVNGTSFPFLDYLFVECISVAHASLRFWFSRLHQQQILLSHCRKVSSQPGMVVAKASLVRSSSSFRNFTANFGKTCLNLSSLLLLSIFSTNPIAESK